MTPPTFNNTPNRQATTSDVGVAWLSRSCAVVATIVMRCGGNTYILMGKRGPACPNEIGKWVLPCGYLDYDETLAQAAVRETFEETGFDVTTLPEFPHSNMHSGQPFLVYSEPNGTVQNVSHHFSLDFKWDNDKEFPRLTNEHATPGEVEALSWVCVEDIDKLDIGFNHDVRIVNYLMDRSFA